MQNFAKSGDNAMSYKQKNLLGNGLWLCIILEWIFFSIFLKIPKKHKNEGFCEQSVQCCKPSHDNFKGVTEISYIETP